MSTAEIVAAVRRGAGLFPMQARGLLEVRGGDRERWLDGMISGDVMALAKGPEGAGCYATLLTNRGGIVADLHVGRFGDVFWLESVRAEIANVKETLERFIIADDVELVDRSDDFAVWGIEGPQAEMLLISLLGAGDAGAGVHASNALPAPDQWCELECAGMTTRVGAFGLSGERAFQLRIAAARKELFEQAIREAAANLKTAQTTEGERVEFTVGNAEALHILRVEAGVPVLPNDLLGVLPPEAHLEHAISTAKGCYVGQEIVARLRSRGQVNHLLVGLRFAAEIAPPAAETELKVGDRKTGRVTSVASSPSEGEIALAFVRREHSEPGTRVSFDGGEAIVSALPFVEIGSVEMGSAETSGAESA